MQHNHFHELTHAAKTLGIPAEVLDGKQAEYIIKSALDIFSPVQTSGHLSISHQSDIAVQIPLAENEFVYSKKLPESKGFMFFDIFSPERNKVFVLNDVRDLCTITSECYGMEYFLVDEYFSYLIAVNWYVIEGAGLARQYLGGQ